MNERMSQTWRTPEQPINSAEVYKKLDRLIKKISKEIAKEVEERHGIKGILNDDCSINMEIYEMLAPETFAKDMKFVKDKERDWSGIKNEDTREYRRKEYGLGPKASDEEIIERFLLARAEEKSRQLEMAMTILLHKAFGKRYIVVRSSKYDDYAGGVDNVLVDKETGAVICGFDEVRNHPRSDRKAEKGDKILEKARSGGTDLIYGLSIDGGKMKLKSMSNLPLFFLSLDEDEYEKLVASIQYGERRYTNLNDIEKKYINKILDSIEEQQKQLLDDKGVQEHPEIVSNLRRVDDLLRFEVD
jgi:hypothetical protein